MTCAEVRETLDELALSGRSSAAVEAHLAACPGCEGEAADLAAVAGLLRAYRVPSPSRDLACCAYRRAAAALPGRPATGWQALAWPLAVALAALPLVVGYEAIVLKAVLSLARVLPLAIVYYLAGTYIATTMLALAASYGAVPILAYRAAGTDSEVPPRG